MERKRERNRKKGGMVGCFWVVRLGKVRLGKGS